VKNGLIRFLLGVVSYGVVASQSAFCQTKPQFPLPEFYGSYAIAGGKTVSLDSPNDNLPKVEVPFGFRSTAASVCRSGAAIVSLTKRIPILELPRDVQFLVFLQPSGTLSPMLVARDMILDSAGFARNVQIKDCSQAHNAHDVKSAAMNAWGSVSLGQVEMRFKPVPGQPEMVIAVPANPLEPGIYSLGRGTLETPVVFAVAPLAQAEKSKCVDAIVQYNVAAYSTGGEQGTTPIPCSGNPDTASDSTIGSGSPVPPSNTDSGGVPPATQACSTYTACFNAALTAYQLGHWSTATAEFEAAAAKDPQKGDPWVWLGRILFRNGQPVQLQDLSSKWDKALSLGSKISIAGCHEINFRTCQRGDFALSTKFIAFFANGSDEVFNSPPQEVEPGHVFNNSAGQHIAYNLKIAGKRHGIDFFPFDVNCTLNMMIQCPEEGITQQLLIATYVSQVVPKLASGALKAQATPASPSAPAKPPKSVCDQAVDAGYAVLSNGHLYKVRLVGPVGPQEQPLFFDEKGTQITDASLLTPLAGAVWTHDNIIASGDARGGSIRVSGILGTSKALSNYTTVQDLIAKSMVEAVEAGVTGGSSLAADATGMTIGILKSQLANYPMKVFNDTAQHGLEKSLAAYKQLEAIPLPPQDATALNAADLARIKDLYLQARTLELPYGALAAKLMPTTGGELADQALKSALSEVLIGPLFAGNPLTKVTLQDLLILQTNLANLAKSVPALQSYSQNLKLATDLNAANNATITKWTLAAGKKCN
jgi:hypothetical protein